MNKTKQTSPLLIIGLLLYCLSLYPFGKGYDKMHHYHMSSSSYSSSKDVNAYVGGDAYNYIINGNYSTAYYTLAAGLVVSGSIFVCAGVIAGKLDDNKEAVMNTKTTPVYMSPEDAKKAALNDALKF